MTLVGRLTRDPEMRELGNNMLVANFTLAVNRPFKSKNEQDADFIRCQTWRKSAENMQRYTAKGDLIGVEGRIQSRNYEDREGNTKTITEVVADRVQFLQPKSEIKQEKEPKEKEMPNEPEKDDLPF